MKRLFVLITVLALAFLLAACGKNNTPETTDQPVTGENGETILAENNIGSGDLSGETTEVVTDETEAETFDIEIAGLTLKYPTQWKDKVTVDKEDATVRFSYNGMPLFALTFNLEGEGNVLGTVVGDMNTVIRVIDYPVNSEDEEVLAMRQDINVILYHLQNDYDFEIGAAISQADKAVFDIETSVVTLKYPSKWKDKVTVDNAGDTVRFSADGTKLFDLVFKEGEGYLLGTYNGTPISIVDYTVTTDEQSAMQEDVNVILQYLMEDENFVISR